jgi:hypothetical protein
MEVIELEVDPDPSIPPPPISSVPDGAFGRTGEDAPFESRSRLVSAPPVALDGLDEPAPGAASDPTIEVAAAEVSRAELDALEGDDGAPSSSRRPISLEEKMSERDEDVVPLHAPPPESGKLPTAAPTIELGFEPPLAKEVTRATPAPQANVASFVGRAPAPSAKTFGELLDDTLSL